MQNLSSAAVVIGALRVKYADSQFLLHRNADKLQHLGPTISYHSISDQIDIPRYEKLPHPQISDVILSCSIVYFCCTML